MFINDFRLIFLFGWVHKIIVKVLSGTLVTFSQLVSQSQNAFICKGSIHDGWIIVFEVLDVIKKDKHTLVFKHDFKKAYNKVDWHFLRFV